jgi:hypothetical protein
VSDTTGCPLGHRCESCGADQPALAVLVVLIEPVGVACLTTCGPCRSAFAAGMSPPIMASTAVRLCEQHAAHVAAQVAREALDEVCNGG